MDIITRKFFNVGNKGFLSFLFLLVGSWAVAQTTLLTQNFGTGTTLPTGWTATTSPTQQWVATTGTASSTYTGASGGTNIVFNNGGTNGVVHNLTYSNSFSTVGYNNITVLWGARATATFTQSVTFQYSTDGTTWNNVSYTQVAANATWALVNGGVRIALPAGAAEQSNLRFRWFSTSANNGNYRIDDFTVQGTASASPEIDILGNAISIADGDATASATDHTDFGSTAVAGGTLTRTFTISNTGTAALTVGAISFSGANASDFSVTTAPASSVAASGSTTFVVTFDPSASGVRNATISIVNNDGNENPYDFAISGTGTASTEVMDFVKVQFPNSTQNITEGQSITFYTQGYEPTLTESPGAPAGVNVWIGYSTTNQNPSTGTWTWVPATYNVQVGNDDEYAALLTGLGSGTYYVATRWQILDGPYQYGDINGVWDSTADNVQVNVAADVVNFANIQFPTTATITQGGSVTVFAQVYEPGVTEAAGQGAGITAWIGYSATNNNPSNVSWTWVPATFNIQSGNNDEYQAAIGSSLAPGTYYYASRFLKTGSSTYVYGGTGGVWNNDSGVLTVNTPQEINVQGNSVSIVDGDTTPSAADHTDFGSIDIAGGTIVRTFTIQNTGQTPLVLDSPAVLLDETDSFSITLQPTSPVAPGSSTTFQVTFDPTTAAVETNTVLIGSNDADEGVYSFAISGSGTISAPLATAATNFTATSFDANWNAVGGATSYRLDVATDPNFVGAYQTVVAWNFPNNPDNATADAGIAANLSKTIGVGGGAVITGYTAGGATTNSVNANTWNSGANIKYWEVEFSTTGNYDIRVSSKQRSSNTGPRDFKLQYKIGAGGTYTDVAGATVTTADNYTTGVLTNISLPSAVDNQTSVYLRWIMTTNTAVNLGAVASTGGSNIDDILIEGKPAAFLPGYENLNVGNVTTYTVNGVQPNTTYYYRVRAVNGATSANSNVITVVPPSVGGTAAANQTICSGSAPNAVTLTGQFGSIVRWESSSDLAFTSPVTIANTTATLSPGTLTQTTYYRAVVQNSTAPVAYSNIVTITVDQPSVGGTVTGSASSCGAVNSGMLTLTGYTGSVVKWQSSITGDFTDAEDIATTADFYNYLNVDQTTYYRAEVKNGACASAFSAPASVTVTYNVWTGAADSSWINVANWSCGQLPATTDNVVISASATNQPLVDADVTLNTLTVEAGASVTVVTGYDLTLTDVLTVDPAATFTLQNNANLIQVNDVANSGDISVTRNSSPLMRLDYTLWSSPVAGQNLLEFSPQTVTTRFYTYNSTTNFYQSIDPATNDFAEGIGYLIRMPNNHPTTPTVWTGIFNGVPHNGDVNVPLTSAVAGQRFNLVGNPYPSPIDINAFVTENEFNITGSLYFWRKTNDATAPSYVTWTAGTFTSNNPLVDVTGYQDIINTGQGFFVEALADAPVVQFDNLMRTGNNSGQFFRQELNRSRIWLNAYNSTGAFSQSAIVYVDEALDEAVDRFDGKYINDGEIALTQRIGGVDYAIQGRAPFDATDIVPLTFKATQAGNYSISIAHVDGLFADGQDIFLRDLLTGAVHDLASPYSFVSEAGTFDSRFEVIYEQALAVVNPVFGENTVIAYAQEGNVLVNAPSAILSNVEVFDMRGRLISSATQINASQAVLPAGAANGVLIVKITSAEGTSVTKKVIR